jgi:hypothetical protein
VGRLQQVITELRRRRVFRALVGWGILSFAVLQVAEPLMHGLQLPEWTLPLVIWILAAGFPVTSVLAWTFDLGPGGVTRTPAVSTDAGEMPSSRRRLALGLGALIVASAVVGAGLAYLSLRGTERQPAVGADGRVFVAVADFANETRDPDLDGLSGLLVTSLEQSERLRVMTRGRMFEVLEQLGHPDARRIDEKLARQVGRKAGVGTLLLATIRRFDEVYSAELQAIDPGRDEYLFTVKVEGRGKQSVPGLVDQLSERARRRFHEERRHVAASSRAVAETVTADLEAYRHFFEGVSCLDRESFLAAGQCIGPFERAVARDPGFALASAYLANLRWSLGLPGADAASTAALANIERVPPGERDKVVFLARVDEFRPERIATGMKALAASPDDRYLAFRVAQMSGYEGDPASAVPILRQIVDAHPTRQSTAYYLLVASLGVLGRRDELAEVERRLASGPQSHVTLEALMVARGFLQDGPGMLEAARRYASIVPPPRREEAEERVRVARLKLGAPAVEGELEALAADNPDHLLTLAFLRTLHGRRREAQRTLDAWATATIDPARRLNAFTLTWNTPPWVAADLAIGLGSVATAARHARRIPEARGASGWSERACMATAFAYAGDAGLATTFAPEERKRPFHARVYQAVARWRAGDRAEALRALDDIASRNIVSWRPAPLPPAFLLGEVAAEAGDHRRAVDALKRFRTSWLAWSSPHTAWVYPRSLYLAARSHAELGEAREARALLEELLGWWRDADPDLPLLAEAKALCKRLDCRSADLLPRK